MAAKRTKFATEEEKAEHQKELRKAAYQRKKERDAKAALEREKYYAERKAKARETHIRDFPMLLEQLHTRRQEIMKLLREVHIPACEKWHQVQVQRVQEKYNRKREDDDLSHIPHVLLPTITGIDNIDAHLDNDEIGRHEQREIQDCEVVKTELWTKMNGLESIIAVPSDLRLEEIAKDEEDYVWICATLRDRVRRLNNFLPRDPVYAEFFPKSQ